MIFINEVFVIDYEEQEYDHGVATEPAVTLSETYECSIQPVSTKERELFPDGYRNRTGYNLFIMGEQAFSMRAIFTIQGKEFVPINQPEWRKAPTLKHTMVTVVERGNA